MNKFNRNYHTHCDLCKHAVGTIEEYVVKAIENGFKAIGISDHAPFDFLEERSLRMTSEEFPEYIRQLKHVIVEYLDYILIYRSLEIEYFKGMDRHYQDLLEKLDYLILGQHYIEMDGELKSVYKIKTINEMKVYAQTVIKAMRTRYFKIIAHPDIFLINQGKMTDEMIELSKSIIETAKETKTLLEINANGFRKRKHKIDGLLYRPYPRNDFWELVHQANAKAIISADAHRPEQLNDQAIEQAIKFSKDLSIVVEEELVLD